MTTHPDTLNLLRETDLGVQMGLYTFATRLPPTSSPAAAIWGRKPCINI